MYIYMFDSLLPTSNINTYIVKYKLIYKLNIDHIIISHTIISIEILQ